MTEKTQLDSAEIIDDTINAYDSESDIEINSDNQNNKNIVINNILINEITNHINNVQTWLDWTKFFLPYTELKEALKIIFAIKNDINPLAAISTNDIIKFLRSVSKEELATFKELVKTLTIGKINNKSNDELIILTNDYFHQKILKDMYNNLSDFNTTDVNTTNMQDINYELPVTTVNIIPHM